VGRFARDASPPRRVNPDKTMVLSGPYQLRTRRGSGALDSWWDGSRRGANAHECSADSSAAPSHGKR
jgi:hypothetical protein